MPTNTLEDCVSAVEHDVARIKDQLKAGKPLSPLPWWEEIFGRFSNGEAHDEATLLNREYRESLRPIDDETAN